MTPRRWAATTLLLLAACGLLWWSTRELKQDERARTGMPTPTATSPDSLPRDFSGEPQLRTAESTAPHQPLPTAPMPAPGSSPVAPPGGTTSAAPTGEATRRLAPGDSADIERELDQVNLMLRDYRTLSGANPTGTNAEIMKALMGDNPRQATLGPPPGQHLNASGELVDPWGTPYFFHQISGLEMEIRSAGPDRILWNGDDQKMTSASGAGVPPLR